MNRFGLAPIFTDGCVLQRRKPISIFGTGHTGDVVNVNIGDNRSQTVVNDGFWQLFLDPMEAAKGLVMEICCNGERVVLSDICIGEVWLAGGQSNMEFELAGSTGGEDYLKEEDSDVRYYYTPKYAYESPRFETLVRESRWECFDRNDARKWSAVGYIFARELSERLGLTVGVIGCNWGGTSATAWIGEEDIRSDEIIKDYFDEYDANVRGVSFEDQEREYDEYIAYRDVWETRCAELYSTVPGITWDEVLKRIGDSRYPGPITSCSPFRPAGLYNTMLSKVIKYSMAGVIYYQGESDDHRPGDYEHLFGKLVDCWRRDNGDDKLCFLAVSLPMHRYEQDPDFKNWPVIRRAQRLVTANHSNMGLAVCTDQGTWNDIHPKDKRTVAHRLVLQALWVAYGIISKDEANGPIIRSLEKQDDQIVLFCSYGGGGIVNKSADEDMKGFEVSVNGGEYIPVSARLSEGRIILKLSDLTDAVNVADEYKIRYLWTNWTDNIPLYGINDIPLEPFEI